MLSIDLDTKKKMNLKYLKPENVFGNIFNLNYNNILDYLRHLLRKGNQRF